MPELPEVETVRRGIEPAMVDATFVTVEQRRPDLRFPLPVDFATRLQGQRVISLGRRAKYLLLTTSGGEVLIMHLGMSGRFTVALGQGLTETNGARSDLVGEFAHAGVCNPKHDHVVFHMSNGSIITYNDPRRFGYMDLVTENALADCHHFSKLGVEPLGNSFHSTALASMAANRTTNLKAFLLDQRHVAGLGNIYVCEALYRARLSPRRQASCLALSNGKPSARCERLVPIIKSVLEEAIAAGGSTLKDYAHTDGSLGYFQHSFAVYGREGEPCLTPACSAKIERNVQAGRSTFYCGNCQR